MNKKLGKKILSLFLIITFVFSAFGIVRATADSKAFTLTDAKIKEKSDAVEATVSVSDGKVVNNLTFHKVNDYIIYTLTFKNNDSKDYVIKGITDNNASEYVSYDYDQHKDETIKAGETKDILVKVTYKKEVTDADKRDSKDPVTLSFEIEDTEGNTVTSNIVINPKTSDGIMMYVILASISLIGLSVLLIKNKKSGMVLVIAAIIAPIAVKAAEASFIITINNDLKLHDKVLVTTIVNGEKTSKLIPYENKFTKPADPVIDGVEFSGWFIGDEEYNFDKEVSDDVVITAKLKLIEYTVTFDPNGGKVATESIKFVKGQSVSTAVPFMRKGYTFTGWYDSADDNANLVIPKNGSFTPSSGNITVYAHWEIGDEPNLIDKDGSNTISAGDIVTFGPEEFIVIHVYNHGLYSNNNKVKLITKNPLGDINGPKQATSNLYTKEYSDSVYWINPGTPETPTIFIPEGYDHYQDFEGNTYINNYGSPTDALLDLTVNNNSLYPILKEYHSYLNNMINLIYNNEEDIHLLEELDASNLGCRFDAINSCPSFLNDGYSFWIGSSYVSPFSTLEDSMNRKENAYINAEKSCIESTSISNKLYIRPVIYVSANEIVVPWN